MRLTDIFFADKQIAEKQKTEQPDYAKTAAVNRQIRSMVPGQTIQGEIVSKNGGEIQIKLADDMVMNAKLEQNMNLEVGRNMTFEVRNNGRTLTLSPLFANTATAANTLKALDMALLSVNETTVEMTRLLMDAGLSVDKASLQQVYRESGTYPGADISDIVDLHRLSLPVNAENIEQIASYKNLTHQIIDGMADVTRELSALIDAMAGSGDTEGAAKLYGEILNLSGEAGFIAQETAGEALSPEQNPGQGQIQDQAQNEIQSQGQNPEPVSGQVPGSENGFGADGNTKVIIEEARTETLIHMADAAGKENGDGRSGAADAVQTGKLMSPGREADAPGAPADSPSGITGRQISSGTEPAELLKTANEVLQRALLEHDAGALKKLLGDPDLRKTVEAALQKAWTLKPEDVADSKKVEELYSKLNRQLKSLSQALESGGQISSGAYRAVTNMSQNVDFLHQLNQMYAYVQLPLRLNQGKAHGDLYVYTNKKNLSAKDGRVSALLHLDMEHLGPVDVYVALENSNVSTNFYVQDDSMLDFLSEHMDILTARLEKRGYHCTFGLQVRGTDEEKEGGVRTLLKQEGHVALAEYAFDVRA